MLDAIGALVTFLLRVLVSRRELVLENMMLRQQLAVLRRKLPRARLRPGDRRFWLLVRRLWGRWSELLVLVRPQTVVRWHRAGFRWWWRWKSARRAGRPPKDATLRALVVKLADDNPTWGAPRIHGELLKLGFAIAQSTVSKYLPRKRRPPDEAVRQRWRTFLANHLPQAAGIDFFVIPTLTFTLLYGFVVLGHGRRRILHLAVTEHPTGEWTRRHLLEAFPWDTAPRFLHRDRDSIYDGEFRAAVKALGIDDVPSAPRSPWQNPFAERVIGSIRSDLLDHVIVLNEGHARRLLRGYKVYYNASRNHLSLGKDPPIHRPVQGPERGERIVALPHLGGLHHRYERRV